MTISNQSMKVTVTGNGAQSTFNYGFLIPSQTVADLYLVTVADGTASLIAKSAWTITGAGAPTGGTFTYPKAGSGLPPITATHRLVLVRNVPATQVTNLVNQGAYYPGAVEGGLDWIEMQVQQLRDELSRTLRGPVQDAAFTVLPPAASRENTIQGYDENGAPIALPIQPDNNTTVIAAGSTTARTLAVRFSERKNVKDYGAIGDGVTDDTAAIQAAVNTVIGADGGGVVYFPPGLYKTSAAITVTQDCVTILGDALGQNSIGTQIVGSGNHDIITVTGTSFFTLRDIGLAHPAGGLVSVNALLNLTGCYYATVQHVSGRFYWNGFTFAGSNQIHVTDVELLNNQALSGTSWGIGLVENSGVNTFGVKLNDVRLQGVNDTVGSVGIYGISSATVYATQVVIRNYAIAILLALGTVGAGRNVFWRLSQIEVETCNEGIVALATTRFTAVGCQVALSNAASGHGWRFGPAANVGDVGDVSLIGCMSVNNVGHGYYLNAIDAGGTFVFEGCKASGNSVGAPGTFDGLNINTTNNVTIAGGRYGGAGGESVPTATSHRNGIRVDGASCIGISIIGANLEGNVTAPYASAATVPPTVIGSLGLGDAFSQVRVSTDVNLIQFTSVGTTFSPLISAVGTDANINLRLSAKGTGTIVCSMPLRLPTYTVAGVPAAGGSALDSLIMVSNESGGRVPAFSDGTNWRRVTDRAIIS